MFQKRYTATKQTRLGVRSVCWDAVTAIGVTSDTVDDSRSYVWSKHPVLERVVPPFAHGLGR